MPTTMIGLLPMIDPSAGPMSASMVEPVSPKMIDMP